MNATDDFRLYLPKYLSSASHNELFNELKSFPENLDQRMYYTNNESIILQGDIIQTMPFFKYGNFIKGSKDIVKYCTAIVLSNTCDIDLNNKRLLTPSICYAPIVEINIYEKALREKGYEAERIEGQITSIKKQRVTNLFFLPESNSYSDSIALLDKINCLPLSMPDFIKIKQSRITSLSNYGFYLLLYKLSIHFCRIQDGIDRKI